MLLICHLVVETLKSKNKFKDMLIKTLKFFVTGAVGMVLYYAVFNALLKITGTELLDYQGFESAASLSAIDIFGAFYVVKNVFIWYNY